MIQHSVFLRFKASFQAPDKEAIYASLADLQQDLPGGVDFKSGPNVSTEGLNGGFLDGFSVTFTDADALDIFLSHPKHREINEHLLAVTDGGLSGMLVFDMEV
ncbi:Dabb family protein [Rhizobium halophytocola]|uniref:Stress-response A/B barrel domain-containing protein n=1 Tax=Rhizobium halophytocola TaxID=735519 RepID=A0ABS4DX76_9HYPH|nr:Dabb family protein [Rhizobium halophytocola]MBP1850299.1 hypothetical protein [Rhizobium halophytocola]